MFEAKIGNVTFKGLSDWLVLLFYFIFLGTVAIGFLYWFISEVAAETSIHPILPDETQSSYVIEGDMAYPAYPNTQVRDLSQPGYRVERDDYLIFDKDDGYFSGLGEIDGQ